VDEIAKLIAAERRRCARVVSSQDIFLGLKGAADAILALNKPPRRGRKEK
jgi:hypothetical protein